MHVRVARGRRAVDTIDGADGALCSCVFTARATEVDIQAVTTHAPDAICNDTIPGSHLVTFKAQEDPRSYGSGAYADSYAACRSCCCLSRLTELPFVVPRVVDPFSACD
jgi:hypothetical protein